MPPLRLRTPPNRTRSRVPMIRESALFDSERERSAVLSIRPNNFQESQPVNVDAARLPSRH